MQEFNIGDKVSVVVDSSFHSGLPNKSFHGLTGTVDKKRGEAYEVKLLKGNQHLTVVTKAVHLKRLN